MDFEAHEATRNPTAARGLPTSLRIQSALRRQIIDLQLPPGAPIVEKALSDFYRVSRTPVRDALIRLAEERLVEIYPQRGTFVSRIRIPAVRDAMVLRRALERLTVRDAAIVADVRQVSALKRILERQSLHDRFDDLLAFHAADDDFHEAIAMIGNHENLWRVIKSEKAQVERCRNLSSPLTERRHSVMAQHAAIVDAIETADADLAESAMDHHLRDVLPTLHDLQRAHPDFFEAEGRDMMDLPFPAVSEI